MSFIADTLLLQFEFNSSDFSFTLMSSLSLQAAIDPSMIVVSACTEKLILFAAKGEMIDVCLNDGVVVRHDHEYPVIAACFDREMDSVLLLSDLGALSEYVTSIESIRLWSSRCKSESEAADCAKHLLHRRFYLSSLASRNDMATILLQLLKCYFAFAAISSDSVSLSSAESADIEHLSLCRFSGVIPRAEYYFGDSTINESLAFESSAQVC